MIERTRDVALVNRLVARDFEGADFSEVLAEPLHVCLIEGESGALFMWRGPGIYEVHLFFAVRGREALNLIERMFAILRQTYGAQLFWALVPVESLKVKMFASLLGWASLGVKETRHGEQELLVSERNLCLQL